MSQGPRAGFTIKIPIRIAEMEKMIKKVYDQDDKTNVLKLSATCNICAHTYTNQVTFADWAIYVSGEYVQDVWPSSSINDREVIVANRPGNEFGRFGFMCEKCTEELTQDD